jgi:antiviral helicase SLH1
MALRGAIDALPDVELDLNGEEYDFENEPSGDDRPDGGDVWDFVSEDEADLYSTDDAGVEDGAGEDSLTWLAEKCTSIASKNGLSAQDFQNQLLAMLQSVGATSEQELQSGLVDLVGLDDFDFIADLLAKKDEILVEIPVARGAGAAQHESGKKLLSKVQREEALRQQDRMHKSQPLSSAQSREPQYPHVYKSYEARNTLSISGQRYALPQDSQSFQFDKYEEQFIPAGRKGVLGPGQHLAKISDLDGLCRNTFKGYETLNRMQSLVYPVAYKTSENMLICAPTGAVWFLAPM